MTNEQLEYVQSQLNAGASVEDIRAILLKNGYGEVHIEELFTAAGISVSNTYYADLTPNIIKETTRWDQTAQGVVAGQPYSAAPLSIREFIGKSFSLTYSKIKLIVLGLGIFSLLTSASAIIVENASETNNLGEIILSRSVTHNIIYIFIVLFSYLYTYATIYNTDLFDSLVANFRKIFSQLFITIITILSTLSGLFLLIVPGLIIYIYLIFGHHVLLKENINGYKTLSRSYQLVSGEWFYVAARLVLLFIISLLFSILLSFLLFFTIGIVIGFLLAFFEQTQAFSNFSVLTLEYLQMLINYILFPCIMMLSLLITISGITVLFNQLSSKKPVFNSKDYEKLQDRFTTATNVSILIIFLIFLWLFMAYQMTKYL